jgi:hypothetical protein
MCLCAILIQEIVVRYNSPLHAQRCLDNAKCLQKRPLVQARRDLRSFWRDVDKRALVLRT